MQSDKVFLSCVVESKDFFDIKCKCYEQRSNDMKHRSCLLQEVAVVAGTSRSESLV